MTINEIINLWYDKGTLHKDSLINYLVNTLNINNIDVESITKEANNHLNDLNENICNERNLINVVNLKNYLMTYYNPNKLLDMIRAF